MGMSIEAPGPPIFVIEEIQDDAPPITLPRGVAKAPVSSVFLFAGQPDNAAFAIALNVVEGLGLQTARHGFANASARLDHRAEVFDIAAHVRVIHRRDDRRLAQGDLGSPAGFLVLDLVYGPKTADRNVEHAKSLCSQYNQIV
jgi:hypothetical protein